MSSQPSAQVEATKSTVAVSIHQKPDGSRPQEGKTTGDSNKGTQDKIPTGRPGHPSSLPLLFEPKMFVSCKEKQDEGEANCMKDAVFMPQKHGKPNLGDMVRLRFRG